MTFRGYAVANDGFTSGSSTAVLTLPSGVTAGDALVVASGNNWNTPTATMPAGWTLLDGPTDNTGGSRCYLWAKIADAADVTAGSVTVTWSQSTRCVAGLLAFSGVDTDPFGTPVHTQGVAASPLTIGPDSAPESGDFGLFAFYVDASVHPAATFPGGATTDGQASLNMGSGANVSCAVGHATGTTYTGGDVAGFGNSVGQAYTLSVAPTSETPTTAKLVVRRWDGSQWT